MSKKAEKNLNKIKQLEKEIEKEREKCSHDFSYHGGCCQCRKQRCAKCGYVYEYVDMTR